MATPAAPDRILFRTDPLQTEETAVSLLAVVLGSVYQAASPKHVADLRGRESSIANDARVFINRRFAERLTLSEIARAIDASPFALCRAFHRTFGTTLHRFVIEIRLRHALERLDGADDLTGVALELGFSSHSHFSATCRSVFGQPPSSNAGDVDHDGHDDLIVGAWQYAGAAISGGRAYRTRAKTGISSRPSRAALPATRSASMPSASAT